MQPVGRREGAGERGEGERWRHREGWMEGGVCGFRGHFLLLLAGNPLTVISRACVACIWSGFVVDNLHAKSFLRDPPSQIVHAFLMPFVHSANTVLSTYKNRPCSRIGDTVLNKNKGPLC